MENAAKFIADLLTANWDSSNSDDVTPQISVGYDTNVVKRLRKGRFQNNSDIVYVKETPNAYVSNPNQIGDNGARTRTRVDIYAFSASSSGTITEYIHGQKLINEAENIINKNRKQGTTYCYVKVVGGSNDCNTRNRLAKYRLSVELVQMNKTW